MSDDLQALVKQACGGDSAAMDVLLRQNLPGLRAYLRLQSDRKLRARESVSDLVQSVCRELLQDLPSAQVETEQAFRCWLYTSAHRKILDRRKYWVAEKRDVSRSVPADGADAEREQSLLESYAVLASPSRHAAANEEIARIENAFEQLPDEYREVISLARFVGLSHAEIAARMGRTEEAVRQLLTRARARLARLLSG